VAVRVFNGTNYDTVLGTNSMGASNISLSTVFQAGVAQTAPNTTNYAVGVCFYIASLPSAGDVEIEIRESGVSVISAIALRADLNLGMNVMYFTAPGHLFTTTAAGAYRPYIRNTTNNSGTVARDGSGAVPLLAMIYDTNSALGTTDDPIWGGRHNSGLTTASYIFTGTSNAFGSGASKGLSTNTNRLWGVPMVCNGATVYLDDTADCKITPYGNIFVMAGGLFDKSANSGDVEIVSEVEFKNDADGDFTLMTASGLFGGRIYTDGMEVAVESYYNGGLGTAASTSHNYYST
jgi:hypothetical protein